MNSCHSTYCTLKYIFYIFVSGKWCGHAKFKMSFNHGGAIEFGQAMLQAGKIGEHFRTLSSDYN